MEKEVIKLEPKFPKIIKVNKTRVADARVSTEKYEQHNSLETQKDYFIIRAERKYTCFKR